MAVTNLHKDELIRNTHDEFDFTGFDFYIRLRGIRSQIVWLELFRG
jgi:hypothetical protein